MNEPAEKFYFVRHGQTEANIANLAAGCGWDVELNDAGMAQAMDLAAGERLKACTDVKSICVSPLVRAKKTAEIINEVLLVPMTVVDELKEWDLGDWEHKPWDDLPNLFHPDSNPPNGESQIQFGGRVAKALNFVFAQPGPVMIVAHGGVWHALSRLLSLPHRSIGNCDLICVSRESAATDWVLS